MFHAPMGRFQLELIYCFTFIFHRRPIQHLYVFSCRPFVVNKTFSTGLVGVEVTSVTYKTCWKCCFNNGRPKERNTQMLAGTAVGKKGKTIN